MRPRRDGAINPTNAAATSALTNFSLINLLPIARRGRRRSFRASASEKISP